MTNRNVVGGNNICLKKGVKSMVTIFMYIENTERKLFICAVNCRNHFFISIIHIILLKKIRETEIPLLLTIKLRVGRKCYLHPSGSRIQNV